LKNPELLQRVDRIGIDANRRWTDLPPLYTRKDGCGGRSRRPADRQSSGDIQFANMFDSSSPQILAQVAVNIFVPA
jgi:hypothetical protein